VTLTPHPLLVPMSKIE